MMDPKIVLLPMLVWQ